MRIGRREFVDLASDVAFEATDDLLLILLSLVRLSRLEGIREGPAANSDHVECPRRDGGPGSSDN